MRKQVITKKGMTSALLILVLVLTTVFAGTGAVFGATPPGPYETITVGNEADLQWYLEYNGNHLADGVTIQLTGGTYIIDSALFIQNARVTLKGDGNTVIRPSNSYQSTSLSNMGSRKYLISAEATAFDFTLDGVTLDMTGYSGSDPLFGGLNIYKATGVTVMNTAVKGGGTGINMNGGSVTVSNFTTDGNQSWGYGIVMDNGAGIAPPELTVGEGVDHSIIASVTGTVTILPTLVKGVSLSPSDKSLEVGDDFTLKAEVKPANATNTDLIWTSTDATVATVDTHGKVTAVKAGTAVIKADTVDGGYTAICVVTVKDKDTSVSQKDLGDLTADLIPPQTYTGQKLTPDFSVAQAGTVLKKGVDYSADYTNNVNAGTAVVILTGKGIYQGTKIVTFEINPAPISKAVAAPMAVYEWNGKNREPVPAITYGTQALAKNTDFTVSYKSNKDIGTATVNITGTGNFGGTMATTFKIVPRKTVVTKVTANKGKSTVIWKKVSGPQKVTAYQVQYRAKAATKWTTKTVSAKKAASLTLKNLKKGKQYEVRVRACKTVAGTKYFADWSDTKTSKKIK
jgi:hypothetical protein